MEVLSSVSMKLIYFLLTIPYYFYPSTEVTILCPSSSPALKITIDDASDKYVMSCDQQLNVKVRFSEKYPMVMIYWQSNVVSTYIKPLPRKTGIDFTYDENICRIHLTLDESDNIIEHKEIRCD